MIRHLSHSAMSDYDTCPKKFKLARIDKLDGRMHLALPAGVAFHTMTEDYDTHQRIIGTYKKYLDHELVKRGIVLVPGESPDLSTFDTSRNEGYDWWVAHGTKYFNQYVEWRESSKWDLVETHWAGQFVPKAIELPLEIEIDGVKVVGQVDRIFRMDNGQLVLVDIKTGARMWPSDQLQTYAEILSRQDLSVDFVAYYDARKAKVTPLDLTVGHPGLDHKVERIWAGIRNEEFEPTPGRHCNYCSQRFNCDTFKENNNE